ncbi:MAG: CHAP domain-containing protein [Leifsonia sp.]
MIDSGPSGAPENADVLPSRRALRAQREAAEAAAAAAESAAENVESADAPAELALKTAVLPIIISNADVSASSIRMTSVGGQESAMRAAPRAAPTSKPRSHPSPSGVLKSEPRPQRSKPAPAARRTGSRHPLTAIVALVAIPGLFLTTGLPAYAFDPQAESNAASTAHATTQSGAQGVVVAAGAAHTVVSRDGFSASTVEQVAELAAELRREGAAAAARASAATYATSGIRAEGDDYPWPFEATDTEGGGLSPLGYYYRECVDFVAWRLNRDAGVGGSPWKWTWSKMTPGNGDASGWADAWASHGWTTSSTPVVGSVAWFPYNHVAYVQSVPGDGTVVLEEYNWMGTHSYHTRTVPIGDVALYLYPPG